MNLMEISNLSVSKYFREYLVANRLKDNHAKLQRMIKLFPFHKLLECDGRNYELTSTLSEILSIFAPLPVFLQNTKGSVEHSVDFVLRNSVFLIKRSNSGVVLAKLMHLLHEICKWLNDFKQVNVERICDVLLMLFQSEHDFHAKLPGLKIIAMALLSKNVSDTCRILRNCIEEIFRNLNPVQDNTELFKMFEVTLRKCEDVSEFGMLFSWMEAIYPQYINMNVEAGVLSHVLDSILVCYEKKAQIGDFVGRINDNLTRRLDVICYILVCEPSLKAKAALLLKHVLIENCFRSNLTWPGGAVQLRDEIGELAEYDDWSRSQSNVFFYVAFLQHLNNVMQWSPSCVLRAIHGRMMMNSFVPPVVLKSIGYLYSVFSGLDVAQPRGTKFFIFQQLSMYKQLITYHPAHLRWLLKEAPTELKFQVLQVCLERDDRVLFEICGNGQEIQHLVDYIVWTKDSTQSKERAIGVLQTFRSASLSKYVIKSITSNAVREPELVGYLFQTKPLLPNNKDLCLCLIDYLGNILCYIRNSTSIQYVCRFIKGVLKTYKLDERFFAKFVNIPFVVPLLIVISTSRPYQVAKSTIDLLRTLLRLQARHLLPAAEVSRININSLLCGPEAQVKDALSLLFLILKPRTDVPLLGIDDLVVLELYHGLHNLLCQVKWPLIIQCMTYLLQKYDYLAYSVMTKLLIQHYCFRAAKNLLDEFLSFVKVWIAQLQGCGRDLVPELFPHEELLLFLSSLVPNETVKEVLSLIKSVRAAGLIEEPLLPQIGANSNCHVRTIGERVLLDKTSGERGSVIYPYTTFHERPATTTRE